MLAAVKGHREFVSILVAHGADVNAVSKVSALEWKLCLLQAKLLRHQAVVTLCAMANIRMDGRR